MVQDNREQLLKPIHGIYIPILLCIVGTYIVSPPLIPYVVAALALFAGYHVIRVKSQLPELSQDRWVPHELMDMTIVSKNTAIYRFKLYKDYDTLEIPVGQHVGVRVTIDGKQYVRYYTPISNQYDEGFFDLMIKSYKDGTVSKYFAGLNVGELVEFKGPVGRINYQPNMAKEIYMIAGGSGITPMLQVMGGIVTTPEDTTKVSLLYANDSPNDILLKEELDELASKYPYFKVEYVLKDAPANWTGHKGLVTKELLEQFLPSASDDRKVFVCGPKPMETNVLNWTNELGWQEGTLKSKQDDQVFVF